MILTAKHRRRTLRLLTVALILIGLTAALAACKQPVLTSITSGLTQACGLKQDGTPVCWGVGQLGYTAGPKDGEDIPPDGEIFTAISAGTRYTCGLKADGIALCWGYNHKGQATIPDGILFSQINADSFYTMWPYDGQKTSLLGRKFRGKNGRSGRGEIQGNHHRRRARMRPQRGRISRLLGIKLGRTSHTPGQ